MPFETILYLAFVVAVLAEFAAVLTYAEWATRHATDNTPRRAHIKREASQDGEDTRPISKAA